MFWWLLGQNTHPTPAFSRKDGELPWQDIFTTTLILCLDRPCSRLRYLWITQRTMSGQWILSDTRALLCCSITGIIDWKTDLWICHTGASQCRCLSCLASSLLGLLGRLAVLSLLIDSLGWIITARRLTPSCYPNTAELASRA